MSGALKRVVLNQKEVAPGMSEPLLLGRGRRGSFGFLLHGRRSGKRFNLAGQGFDRVTGV